ncbi:MAG: hypothetical protein Q3M24_02270 [Candidatus Electrothrix aestuarii]|uniref:DUF3828 domain-containing protein n=1 Tax=Candidatus Electrothrix aestuarii TaxID=3062594 RepID=A0AAU8LX51_9BACT|nr:hypothetical protein [Candidatus Electrothrix aestuarii]
MDKLIAILFGSPVHTLLIVAGLFFLLLAIVSKVGNTITVSPGRQKAAVLIGSILLGLGLFLQFQDSFSPPPPSPQGVVANYIHLIDSQQFTEAKKLYPNLNIEAATSWMKSENNPERAIHSINLVDFLDEDISTSTASLAAKIRYCREDGSGTDEEKIFLLEQTENQWIIQSANQPRSVKMIRCF